MLRERVITAAVLLVVFVAVVFFLPPKFFSGLVALVALVAAWEWSRLCKVKESLHQNVYAIAVCLTSLLLMLSAVNPFMERWLMIPALVFWLAVFLLLVQVPHRRVADDSLDVTGLLSGLFVLSSTAVAMQALHHGLSDTGSGGGSTWLLLYSLGIVWSMDIGAYFSGKRFGKNKLAPEISPGKTVEGVFGGLACAFVLLLLALIVSPEFRDNSGRLLVATLAAALISVVGDLYESRFKRAADMKDSSQLLPGHGGVLDRIDGVVASLPVFLCLWVWS